MINSEKPDKKSDNSQATIKHGRDQQPKDQFIGAALTMRKLQKMKIIPPQITPINLNSE